MKRREDDFYIKEMYIAKKFVPGLFESEEWYNLTKLYPFFCSLIIVCMPLKLFSQQRKNYVASKSYPVNSPFFYYLPQNIPDILNTVARKSIFS